VGSRLDDLEGSGVVSEDTDGLVPEPVLTDGVVRLRRWSTLDLACVRAASEEGSLAEGTTIPPTYTEPLGTAWIERQHSRVAEGQGWSLAVTEVSDDRAIGCIVLLLRPQRGVAGLGYWILPEARGRGLASRAVALLTGWGLEVQGLARVEAWVEPHNEASASVLARCGFEQEGTLRSFLAFPTRRGDALVLSRVQQDVH
jgi:ribosomal-protein-alanine N-acetyltransferase